MVVDAELATKLEGVRALDLDQAAGDTRRIVPCDDDAARALAAKDVTQLAIGAAVHAGDGQVAQHDLVIKGRPGRSKLGEVDPDVGRDAVVGEPPPAQAEVHDRGRREIVDIVHYGVVGGECLRAAVLANAVLERVDGEVQVRPARVAAIDVLSVAHVPVHSGDDLAVITASTRACEIVADGYGAIASIWIYKLVAKD